MRMVQRFETALFGGLFARLRVDAKQRVERAKSHASRDDWHQAEQRPPAEAVDAEEENAATDNEPDAGIVGSNVGFHGSDWLRKVYRKAGESAAHWLVKSARNWPRGAHWCLAGIV